MKYSAKTYPDDPWLICTSVIHRLGHRTSVVRRSIATQQSAESWNDGAYLSESILSSSAAVASFRQTKDGVDFENLPPELFKDEVGWGMVGGGALAVWTGHTTTTIVTGKAGRKRGLG